MGIILPIDTPYGQAGIASTATDPTSLIVRIYLPGELRDAPSSEAVPYHPTPRMEHLASQIRSFLSGEDVDFSLEDFDMGAMSAFQRKVLSLCRQIPRGRVSTYGGLAERLLAPGAARAVGTALARNPFPLVIPCHRVVRAGGDPGKFGGGPPMKRALLEMEGVHIDERDKIRREFFW